MPKNQNTLACYLDKKTSMDNPGRAFLSTQSTAKSDSNTGHHTIGTGGCVFRRRSALDTVYVELCCTTAVLRKLPSPAALQQLFRSMSETMPTKLLALIMRALKGQTTSVLQK
nr:uncharacterized protein LOC126537795 [Dermacentor andersoni]XP_054930437.1 uncharacterized protein LOC126537795 [Dermacentor andersoni]